MSFFSDELCTDLHYSLWYTVQLWNECWIFAMDFSTWRTSCCGLAELLLHLVQLPLFQDTLWLIIQITWKKQTHMHTERKKSIPVRTLDLQKYHCWGRNEGRLAQGIQKLFGRTDQVEACSLSKIIFNCFVSQEQWETQWGIRQT